MLRHHKTLLACLATVIALSGHSQTLADAKELIAIGDYEQATEMLEALVASKPKDADASYNLALALMGLNRNDEALQQLLDAKKKGSNDATFKLAEIALNRYEIDEAQSYIAEYRKALKKAKKGTVDLSTGFDERLDKISAMLDRVEEIVVIDSIQVDADSFFRFYALTKESGLFKSPDTMGAGFKAASPTVIFETGDNRERIWAIENSDHNFELVSSSALFGNKWTDPISIGSDLGEGGDANYPFLLSDGMTLYFANDGENSIGGYDIFITRRDGEEFLQPTNIGFPYNSPADDYLLAIDESKGIGWWATNRNSDPDSVTIYAFIPSDMRINYPVDDPNLAALARLDSYRATWKGNDYTSKKSEAFGREHRHASTQNDTDTFTLSVPGKGVYTRLSDFKNSGARNLMKQYLVAESQLADMEDELESLRANYAINKSANNVRRITSIEQEVERRRESLRNLRNEVIAAER